MGGRLPDAVGHLVMEEDKVSAGRAKKRTRNFDEVVAGRRDQNTWHHRPACSCSLRRGALELGKSSVGCGGCM